MGGGALIRSEWLSMDLLAASGEPSADRAFADSSKEPLHSFFRTAASRPAGRTQGASLKAATGQGRRLFSTAMVLRLFGYSTRNRIFGQTRQVVRYTQWTHNECTIFLN
jgi:hypothetical protein